MGERETKRDLKKRKGENGGMLDLGCVHGKGAAAGQRVEWNHRGFGWMELRRVRVGKDPRI